MFQKLPTRRSTRWKRIGEFIKELCHKPRRLRYDAEARAQRIGHPIPIAATEWFDFAASQGDYWTGQDRLWLHKARSSDGPFVPLMIENQNVFRMGYHVDDATHPDPPIHRYVDGASEFLLSPGTTEFAIQMLILETIWRGKHRYFDCVDGVQTDVLAAILARYRQTAITDLNLWTTLTRFLSSNDAIFRIDFSDASLSHAYIGFAANSRAAFEETCNSLTSMGCQLQL